MRPSSKYSLAHQALVIQRAIAMRSALTPSEQKLWALLRCGQLGVGASWRVCGRALGPAGTASAPVSSVGR
jgi:hypothetical protein